MPYITKNVSQRGDINNNKSATEPKEKLKQDYIFMVPLLQVFVAHYIRNFGMESPLKLFTFKLPYQLENDNF